ncbi:MAG: family 43 glycosylhydrolase [Rikenellaceae bacterium]
MKKLFTSMLALSFAMVASAQTTDFVYKGNPLVRHIFTADPTARVFNDKLYVYTSHDRTGAKYFTMLDWHVFSTDDMVSWSDHGAFFGLDDIPWAKDMAWAPDCVERNGKYYFYYPVEREKIGVAVSDSPVSGFKDSGKPLIDKNKGGEKLVGREPIDPSVIIHEGQAYMFFGCRDFRYIKLKENMVEVQGKIKKVDLRGNEGHKENFDGYYGEGPFIFKRGDTFYMMYSNGWGKTSNLVYATAKHPEGPFTYQGSILEHTGCTTTHGSIVEFKGNWYLFYHNQELSNMGFRRSVAFDRLEFSEDGKILPVKISRSALSEGKDYYTGKGRIALSSDGNMHDNDDMQATMMTLMILAKAGLQSQTTLYTYADHVWGSEKNDLDIMRISAEETGKRFGFNKTKFMAAVENPEAAYKAMSEEILKSTAEDPLFIVAAGPMQVVGEAITLAIKEDPHSLDYVTVVSHSDWNNAHSDKPYTGEAQHSGWTWDKMIAKYGERVNFKRIKDQNGTGVGQRPYTVKNKFSAPSWLSWDWMRAHADENVRWIYERGRKNPCGPDFSDAGLVYYLCADLYGERGDEMGNPEKLRQWFGDDVISK